MKIALLQCDVKNGDFPYNCDKILSLARDAVKEGANFCICPNDSIGGPNLACFNNLPEFEDACKNALAYLAKSLPPSITLLCASPTDPNQSVLCTEGDWQYVPNDFLWNANRILKPDLNALNPEYETYDLVISELSIPFSPYGQEKIEKQMSELSQSLCAFGIKANLVGGYGEYVYGGASFVTSPLGAVIARAPAFQEAVLIFDTKEEKCECELYPYPDADKAQWLALCTGIRDYTHKSGLKKVVIGLSGGMDSALVCCLAADSLGPENVIAVMLPSRFSSKGSVDDSQKLCANLGINPLLISIEKIMQCCIETLDPLFTTLPPSQGDLTFENIQPRIRTLLLMAISNRCSALLLNTGNRSESFMGYSTLYGDTAGAISVLGDLYKTRVYELAHWYNLQKGREIIPREILEKAPSAELRPDQKDTDSLPPYEKLDPLLEKISVGERPSLDEQKEYYTIRSRFFHNQFKRSQSPKALQVGYSKIPFCPVSGDFIPIS